MRLHGLAAYVDFENLERNLQELEFASSALLGLLMANKEHKIRSLMMGRIACSCGWYVVLDEKYQDATRVARQDALLDDFSDHKAAMARAGH